ncbi:hypothetical protein EV714DRAFT_212436 [Schizophyllum commune]
MAHLTKPQVYNIEDTNIALLGSDLEKNVREHAGDKEPAWSAADLDEPGIRIWRIEQFHVVEWPKEHYGSFYDGDSYIILHTYKKTPESESVSYDLHFWLGGNTSQDEAGTAAYKTVELDDHLHGLPVQYREVQDLESARLISYFPRFLVLRGGVATGFRHVSEAPPPDVRRLYRVTLSRAGAKFHLVVREVPAEAESLVAGDVFVLDMGARVWQLNTKASAGKEKFKAAEFAQSLVNERQGQCEVTVYDEGGPGAGIFLAEFGEGTTLREQAPEEDSGIPPTLYRLSDASGDVVFEKVEPVSESSLHTDDAFLLDYSLAKERPAIFVWIGKGASLHERRLVVQYAQRFLNEHKAEGRVRAGIPIIKMVEGNESDEFLRVMPPYSQAVRLTSVAQELFRESGESDVYAGSVPSDWTVGNVAHGGFSLSLIVQAAILHQRKTAHSEVVHVSAHFLQAVTADVCEVQVRRLRVGKSYANVLAELLQNRQQRILVHLIFGVSSPSPQMTLAPPSPFARRIPLHHHPRNAKIRHLPGKMSYAQHLTWAPDPTILARNAADSPSRTRTGGISGGGFEWGGWMQLKDPKERVTPAFLCFIADVFLGSPPLWAFNAKDKCAMNELNWFPTLNMAVQYVFPIPPADSLHHARRTVGVYFSGRFVNDGRHDATVEVWTAPAELGEGDENLDWREPQRCLATATHFALVVPFSVNQAKGEKAAKL